jgi:hypothetical protein
MKHTKMIMSVLLLAMVALAGMSRVRADEAATHLQINPAGYRIVLGTKGSDFFMGLTRKPVKKLPESPNEDTEKWVRISGARVSPFVIEINERRFAVKPEGFVNCKTGEVLEGTEEGWKVLTSPAIASGLVPWSSSREDFRAVVNAIEGHASVREAPASSEEQKGRPGVFLTTVSEPVFCECGVLFEEVIRATLREPAVESPRSMRKERLLSDEKVLVDGVLLVWLGNDLVNLTTGKQHSHPKKLLYKCACELSENIDMTGEHEVAGLMLALREIERLLFADGRK